jgi:CBS domain-containing protein
MTLQLPVSRIMRREFVSLNRGDTLDFATDVMNLGRIRHLPVLDGGRLVGVVSQRDLLAVSLSRLLEADAGRRRTHLSTVEVTQVMTSSPITVSPDTTAEEAARVMLRHRIGCLPVLDAEDRPIGILTETDLLRVAYTPAEPDPTAD